MEVSKDDRCYQHGCKNNAAETRPNQRRTEDRSEPDEDEFDELRKVSEPWQRRSDLGAPVANKITSDRGNGDCSIRSVAEHDRVCLTISPSWNWNGESPKEHSVSESVSRE